MMQRKTVEEIDNFISDQKPNISACVLGCGQIIENQVLEHTKHDCIIELCTKWKTKCRNCKRMLGPSGNLLTGKEEIYQEWDTHDRLIKKINERYNQNIDPEDK